MRIANNMSKQGLKKMYNMIECLRGLVIVASLVLVGCNIMLTG